MACHHRGELGAEALLSVWPGFLTIQMTVLAGGKRVGDHGLVSALYWRVSWAEAIDSFSNYFRCIDETFTVAMKC